MITVVVWIKHFEKVLAVEKQFPDASKVNIEPSGALTLYTSAPESQAICGFNRDQWISWMKE